MEWRLPPITVSRETVASSPVALFCKLDQSNLMPTAELAKIWNGSGAGRGILDISAFPRMAYTAGAGQFWGLFDCR